MGGMKCPWVSHGYKFPYWYWLRQVLGLDYSSSFSNRRINWLGEILWEQGLILFQETISIRGRHWMLPQMNCLVLSRYSTRNSMMSWSMLLGRWIVEQLTRNHPKPFKSIKTEVACKLMNLRIFGHAKYSCSWDVYALHVIFQESWQFEKYDQLMLWWSGSHVCLSKLMLCGSLRYLWGIC